MKKHFTFAFLLLFFGIPVFAEGISVQILPFSAPMMTIGNPTAYDGSFRILLHTSGPSYVTPFGGQVVITYSITPSSCSIEYFGPGSSLACNQSGNSITIPFGGVTVNDNDQITVNPSTFDLTGSGFTPGTIVMANIGLLYIPYVLTGGSVVSIGTLVATPPPPPPPSPVELKRFPYVAEVAGVYSTAVSIRNAGASIENYILRFTDDDGNETNVALPYSLEPKHAKRFYITFVMPNFAGSMAILGWSSVESAIAFCDGDGKHCGTPMR
jgi:hypothetical protein